MHAVTVRRTHHRHQKKPQQPNGLPPSSDLIRIKVLLHFLILYSFCRFKIVIFSGGKGYNFFLFKYNVDILKPIPQWRTVGWYSRCIGIRRVDVAGMLSMTAIAAAAVLVVVTYSRPSIRRRRTAGLSARTALT